MRFVQDCPVALSLEVIGERWTPLIVRDAFYGVSRFSDFRDHLVIPRAVLTDRLALLVPGPAHPRLTRTPTRSAARCGPPAACSSRSGRPRR
jgi:hypothetical protein